MKQNINGMIITEMEDKNLIIYNHKNCQIRTTYAPDEKHIKYVLLIGVFTNKNLRNNGILKQNLKNGLEYLKGRGLDGFIVGNALSDDSRGVIQSGIKSGWIIESFNDDEIRYFIEQI